MIGTYDAESGFGVILMLFLLASVIPSIAVTVRRLHDTSRSGWWALLCVIPLVSFFAWIIFGVLEGTPGDNEFGPNPKEVMAQ